MSSPSDVVIAGPLAGLKESLAVECLRRGYAPSTVARQLQLVAHLSRWMLARDIEPAVLSWADIARFCSDRELTCVHRFAPPAVMIAMSVVRPGLIPTRAMRPGTELPPVTERLLVVFGMYLRDERALAESTRSHYLYQVRRFALWFVSRSSSDLTGMTMDAVNRFHIAQTKKWPRSTARSFTIAMRCFARWLFLSGRSATDISPSLMTVKDISQDALPKALPAADLTMLFATAMTVRDRAILLLLTRLGLRSNEVSRLQLDDIDWRTGTLLIRGKANDVQLMAVPVDVGEAITAYLSGPRRTKLPCREVFLGTYAPNLPLGRSTVSGRVTAIAARAGIVGRVGAHRLRRSAATAVLAGGGTLEEAGQLLRHRSTQSTMNYARTDLVALARLARPWPASAAEGGL